MSDVIVSVIVPVYNAQLFLDACVGSVLAQENIDLELILVEDGSVDASAALCDKWAKADARITVLHQPNAGPAAARNHGTMAARGRYVLYLDSDDCYRDTNLLALLAARAEAEKLDVLCFNYARFTAEPAAHEPLLLPVTAPANDAVEEMLAQNVYTSSACLKLMRREFLQKNEIAFPLGVRCEDVDFCGRILAVNAHIGYEPSGVYLYRRNMSSATQNVTLQMVQQLYAIIVNLSAVAQAVQLPALRAYVAFQYATLLINSGICRPKAGKDFLAQIKRHAALMQYGTSAQVRLVWRVYRLLGFAVTRRLLTVYFKHIWS